MALPSCKDGCVLLGTPLAVLVRKPRPIGRCAANRDVLTFCKGDSARQRAPLSVKGSKKQFQTDGGAKVEVDKELHKIFDEAVVTVRAGNGGSGEISQRGKGKTVRNFKYVPGCGQPKKIWLPASPPADGTDGGDVIIFCDPALDSLEHLHKKTTFTARSGSSGDPEHGTQAPKRIKRMRRKAQNLRIGVPPGTVVKRRGRLLGELLHAGDELVAACGGKGGLGVVQRSQENRNDNRKNIRKLRTSGIDLIEVEDDDWKSESFGKPGEIAKICLMLRIVADVGIVGLPNAGKSSLLANLTRASPKVAAYPFTTLIPNLGVMDREGAPVLVDLPGLIEGAHVGRGLGRNFLRHLRRTRVFLHVVDGATPDPVADYLAIRTELQMYNPAYCSRPHLVVLNKIDIPEAFSRQQQSIDGIEAAAEAVKEKLPSAALPEVVLAVSAVDGTGVDGVGEWVQRILENRKERRIEVENDGGKDDAWWEEEEGQHSLDPLGWD